MKKQRFKRCNNSDYPRYGMNMTILSAQMATIEEFNHVL